MIPSLLTFTLLAAAVLLAAGLPLLVAPARLQPVLQAFPRHRPTALLTMLLGGGWFLWKITRLGQADFGDYKVILFLLFAATLVGSILYVRDFLVLLSANTGLKSAFGLYDVPARLVLVVILYLFVVAALYYGTLPYRMRDTIAWLGKCACRMRALGATFMLAGTALLAAATQY